MKAVLASSALMMVAAHPALAIQADINCHQLITTTEERMVNALNVATKTGKQHSNFCTSQFTANKAINDWLKFAEMCRSRMADYENRVAQVRGAKQTATNVILMNCKID